MSAERRVRELGLDLPVLPSADAYYGQDYGRMKPFHIKDRVLYLSGHVGERDGRIVHPGRLGEAVTTEQGYEAARVTGLNVLAGVRQALGDLDRVKGLIRTLNFVACAPDYTDVHLVASGLSDLLYDVFGEKAGLGCRATIGVQALARNICFETWAEFEIA